MPLSVTTTAIPRRSSKTARGGTAAEQQNRTGAPSTSAQRGRTGTEGLQGNATGMNVQLNEKQRNEIRTTVINGRGAPRVSHVDFDVTVGNGDYARQDSCCPGAGDIGADRAGMAWLPVLCL